MNIQEHLQGLSFEPEELTETLGQLLDSLAQSLEAWTQGLSGSENRDSLSFGGHAKRLAELEAPAQGQEQLEQIRAFRRASLDINHLDESVLRTLQGKILDHVEFAETGGVTAQIRIRYRPVLVNTVGVETPSGYRQFQLHHGSVTHIPCDVLVLSALQRENGGVDGQVANALSWRYKLNLDPQAVFLKTAGSHVTLQEVPGHTAPFNHVLTLWLPPGDDLGSVPYDEAVRGLFGALLAAEHLGISCERVGLSFLGGHRVADTQGAVSALMFAALDWMKKANDLDTIGCALFQRAELDAWSASMNQVLGRSSAAAEGDPLIDALRAEVLALAGPHRDGVLEPGLKPFTETLKVQGPLCIELVCTFSRTLCEIIVRECLKTQGTKPSGDLLNSIEKLRQSGKVAPWVCSYMHGIRVLGNKSVHPATEPPRYVPSTLDGSDLVSSLAAVRCLLQFWGNLAL